MRGRVEDGADRSIPLSSGRASTDLNSGGRDTALRRSYWRYALGRAVALAALAVAITFSQDHSAIFGLAVFIIFAFVSSVIGFAFVRAAAGIFPPVRILIAQSVLSVVAAIIAAVLVAADSVGGLGSTAALSDGSAIRSLLVVLAGWAAITGSLEMFLGLRSRGKHPAATDWLSVGAFTMLASLVFVLIPPDFSQEFVGEQQVSGVLDSAIVTVGLLGAYAAIAAVFLVIAALSARWSADAVAPGTPQ